MGTLVLQVVEKNLSSLCIGNIISVIVLAQEVAVVLIAMLVISRDIVIVRVLGLQLVFLGL